MNGFLVKSTQAPTVEIDTSVSAVYIRFRKKAKVAKTVASDNPGPIVTVDFDANDEVIGVELIGVKEFGIEVLLQQAHVRAPHADLQKTRYIQTSQALAEAPPN
jgi:uncharacterized protein YuzE